MRIGLNLLFLVPGETGGSETYARQLIPAVAELLGAEALTLFATREADEGLCPPGARWYRLPVPGRSRVRRTLAEQTLLPVVARRSGIDVLHSLHTVAPAISGAKRSVTTVHDLLYLHHPDTHSPLLRRGMSVLAPLAVRRSDRLIAISQATKEDVVRSLGASPDKIDVVHHGPGLAATVEPAPESVLRRRLGLGHAPIIVSPSARRSHKNLPRLLEAFALVHNESILVLPGYHTDAERELAEQTRRLGISDRVRFTGWLPDADLEGLYACAGALVFPSLAEGFGFPVLEAMRHGLPVACSDRTSLPEIAGDAALLFDPESVDAIAGAIREVLSNSALRKRLGEAGRQRASQFSWRRAARETVAVYERALEPGS